MTDIVKQILAKPIQLADQAVKAADEARFFKSDCTELKSKAEKLAALLRQAARASNELYERPTRRIIDDTEQVLDKAHVLVQKCRAHGMVKRVFTIIPAAAFRKMSAQLENSIGDVSWLLRVSASDGGDEYLGLPPIAANEPILCLIWEQIAILCSGKLEDRADAAASLVSLARDNERYGKLIIEEGGVGPLLRLVKEGKVEGQENAARAIGLLGRDPESVEKMIHAGVCQTFAKILKDGPMKVQAVVAWAVSELAAHHPTCQDLFAQHNIIRLLVSHLAFETVQEHSKYSITSKSLHAIVVATNKSPNGISNGHSNGYHNISKQSLNGNTSCDDPLSQSKMQHPLGYKETNQMHQVVTTTMAINQSKFQQSNGIIPTNQTKHVRTNSSHSLSAAITKGRENEDPETKAYMKAMAARALWHLAKGNSPLCRSITESRALLCFAVLLEKGPDDVKYNSAMALMEITAVAEKDPDLRRSAFKPNSPACKAVVDQVLNIIEKADSHSELLIPCMKSVGNLARTFRATETRMISPLVRLLDEREAEVSREACNALTKFVCDENYLHLDHSKAIIAAGGAKYLIQLAYFGEQIVQSPSVILLCYIAMNIPDSEQLAEAKVLTVLEWASKQPQLAQDGDIEKLLQEAKSRLELYQSRGDSRQFP